MYTLENWYPFFIIIGVIALISIVVFWSLRSHSQSSIDVSDALVALCVLACLILVGALFYGLLVNANKNSDNRRVNHQQGLDACKSFEEVSQRALCMSNLP